MANRTVVFDTTKGIIRAELFEEQAPVTAQNFIDLTQKGFYNGLTFHRYEPGFVVQGGDPSGNGTGGSKHTIPLEVSKNLKHDSAGVLAMARSSDPGQRFQPVLHHAPRYAASGRQLCRFRQSNGRAGKRPRPPRRRQNDIRDHRIISHLLSGGQRWTKLPNQTRQYLILLRLTRMRRRRKRHGAISSRNPLLRRP